MRAQWGGLRRRFLAGAVITTAILGASAAAATSYHVTDLVTDNQAALVALGYAPAAHVDPNLINPWGIAASPTGPWWVANQGTATMTVYTGSGASLPLDVTTPQNPAMGPAGPTGLVFNAGSGFVLPDGSASTYIVANLDGSISGWNPGSGSTADTMVPGRAGGNVAVYTGLAIDQVAGKSYLYAANDITGKIDVFNQNFAPVTLTGNFTDPGANPLGLVPFNVQNLDGKIWVTYATPGPTADQQPLGSGFVSEFNANGTFIRRFATGGDLLSPWGITIAPSKFGAFSNDVLIGNFSDGADAYINAFNPVTGKFQGTLSDGGKAISLGELWGIEFGNGAAAGSPDVLYFAAGVGDESHGLLGSISAVPEPTTWLLLIAGFGLIGVQLRRHGRPAIPA